MASKNLIRLIEFMQERATPDNAWEVSDIARELDLHVNTVRPLITDNSDFFVQKAGRGKPYYYYFVLNERALNMLKKKRPNGIGVTGVMPEVKQYEDFNPIEAKQAELYGTKDVLAAPVAKRWRWLNEDMLKQLDAYMNPIEAWNDIRSTALTEENAKTIVTVLESVIYMVEKKLNV